MTLTTLEIIDTEKCQVCASGDYTIALDAFIAPEDHIIVCKRCGAHRPVGA